MKLARSLPAERNRPDVIQQRFDYATWFMNEGVVNHCIFIDECGYNIWTARSCGRARVGMESELIDKFVVNVGET